MLYLFILSRPRELEMIPSMDGYSAKILLNFFIFYLYLAIATLGWWYQYQVLYLHFWCFIGNIKNFYSFYSSLSRKEKCCAHHLSVSKVGQRGGTKFWYYPSCWPKVIPTARLWHKIGEKWLDQKQISLLFF